MKDEQGYDPDLDYTASDNPFWDCTDGAHPAFWRGQDDGVRGAVRVVEQCLDGERSGRCGSAELNLLLERLERLAP